MQSAATGSSGGTATTLCEFPDHETGRGRKQTCFNKNQKKDGQEDKKKGRLRHKGIDEGTLVERTRATPGCGIEDWEDWEGELGGTRSIISCPT